MLDNLTRVQRSYRISRVKWTDTGLGTRVCLDSRQILENEAEQDFETSIKYITYAVRLGATASMGPSHLSNRRQKKAVNFDLDHVELKK